MGEGTCDEEYEPPDSNFIISEHFNNNSYSKLFVKYTGNNVLIIEILDNASVPKSTLLVNCKGQVIQKQIWQVSNYIAQSEKKVLKFNLDSQIAAGTYFLVSKFGNGQVVISKIIISNL